MPATLADSVSLAWALAAMLAAGLVRGFTGFGAAIVMAPILGPLYSPAVAVPTIVALDFVLNLRLVPTVRRTARWREVLRVFAGAAVLLPVGALLLVNLPEDPLVIATGLVVALGALALLAGWQYRGPVNAYTDAAVGGLAGLLGGATSVGGPPVILYLFARPASTGQNRADLIAFIGLANILAIAVFAALGALTLGVLALVAAGLPVYLAGSELGRWSFHRVAEAPARRVVLAILVLNGLIAVARAGGI